MIEEISLETVKGRAIKGVAALSGRTFLLQAISFFGFFFLTVFLGKAEIGLFFAISELVAILGYFSDVGLAAALIQKKEKPQISEIRSTFTIQQALVVTLVILVFLLTPFFAQFYNISQAGIFLLWAFTASFFLSSLKTIPSVLLERHLRFDKLVIVDIVEAFLFNGVAVALAWQGLGVTSYTAAVLIRGIAGVILIYIFSPWQIGLAFDRESLKKLLSFGVTYQANTFLAVVKDRFMNVFLWKIIGAEGVGILGWAQKWAQMPLRFVMDSVMRVTFPAYSRMQDNKEELRAAIEKTIFFVALLTFPSLFGLCLLAKPLVLLIPRYEKWEPALFALYLYAINSIWGAVTTPLTNALTAVGKIKTVFKLMVMWTSLTWVLFPILAVKFGYNGVALAAALVSTSSVVAIWMTKKIISFSFWPSIKKPLLATCIMGFVLLIFAPFLAKNIFGVIVLVFIGVIVYFGFIYILLGQEFLDDVKKIISTVKTG
jgi:O-antigen/teichoic acid export membrane protein